MIAALDALGHADQVHLLSNEDGGALAQIIRRVRAALAAGQDVQQALRDASQSSEDLFSDLTGRLIYRALNVAR